MDEPLISIIIPTYNGSAHILDAVRTASRQTLPNKEIIVIVDGSTDDTFEKLDRLKAGMPQEQRDRLKIIFQENGGVSAARNYGLQEARGNYFALLDDDDTWHTDKLKYQIRHLQQQEAETPGHPILCTTDYKAVDRHNGKIKIRKCWNSGKVDVAIVEGFPPPTTWLFSRQTADAIAEPTTKRGEIKLFDTLLCAGEDFDVLIRLCKIGTILTNINRVLASYILPLPEKAYGNSDRSDPSRNRENQSAARQWEKHGAWMKEQYPPAIYDKMVAWYEKRVPPEQFAALMAQINTAYEPPRRTADTDYALDRPKTAKKTLKS